MARLSRFSPRLKPGVSGTATYFSATHPGWTLKDNHLEREFRFRDFRSALNFTNKVGELAESVNHHPDIHLAWGRVKVIIWTHKVNGLCTADFVLAAKIDDLPR